MRGASVVVDVSNSPSFEDAAVLEFFETSTRNLLAAEAGGGVTHHVALSVVGHRPAAGERLLPGQDRAGEADHADRRSRTRSCTRRSSSSSLDGIADDATDGDTVRLPPALFQPMAADDVAEAVAGRRGDAAERRRRDRRARSTFRLDELVRRAWSRVATRARSSPTRTHALLRRSARRAHAPARRRRAARRAASRTGSRRPCPRRRASLPHTRSSHRPTVTPRCSPTFRRSIGRTTRADTGRPSGLVEAVCRRMRAPGGRPRCSGMACTMDVSFVETREVCHERSCLRGHGQFRSRCQATLSGGDRRAMLSSFDLWSHDDVSAHADAILRAVATGAMPCDTAWPQEQVDVVRRWVAAGKPA